MPLELQNPTALWALALLVPLGLLYVLKVRRERRRVGSTILWSVAKRDLWAQHPFKRLTAEIPLIVQALAIALLVLAFARPATRTAILGGDHVAIVIDVSASMSARSGEASTRIDDARRAAKSIVSALEPGADALLIAAGRDARTACPLERDRSRLKQAIDAVTAGDVEGRLSEAVAIAAERLRSLGGVKQVVLITDGASDDLGALASSSVPLRIVRVGTPIDNSAIVRIDVRAGRGSTGRPEVQAFALLTQYGTRGRDVFVTLRQRNVAEPLASRKVSLAPGQRVPVVLTFEPAPADAGTGLVLELSPPDAMPADDRAFGRVPASRSLPVVLAPAEANPWVKRALAADPDVDVLGVGAADLSKANVPDDALVVCDGFCPTAAPGSDLLVLDPPAGVCRTATVGATIDTPRVTSWSEQDDRLRFLNLDGVQLVRARAITPLGPRESLVRSREGTLVADIGVAGHAGTLVSFDVGESNWPLKSSFVLFVRNLVELARSHRTDFGLGPGRTGEALRAAVPADVESVRAVDPSGVERNLGAHDGLVVLPATERAGFFYLSWEGRRPGSSLVCANLASERESDPAPRPEAPTPGAHGEPPSAIGPGAVTNYTWIAALLALFLVVFDAWWLTRTRRRSALVLDATARRAP